LATQAPHVLFFFRVAVVCVCVCVFCERSSAQQTEKAKQEGTDEDPQINALSTYPKGISGAKW
jgi:L-lysine 2,3-aminomutase